MESNILLEAMFIALDHTTLHNIIFKEEADAQLDIEHRPVGADTYFASQLQCW